MLYKGNVLDKKKIGSMPLTYKGPNGNLVGISGLPMSPVSDISALLVGVKGSALSDGDVFELPATNTASSTVSMTIPKLNNGIFVSLTTPYLLDASGNTLSQLPLVASTSKLNVVDRNGVMINSLIGSAVITDREPATNELLLLANNGLSSKEVEAYRKTRLGGNRWVFRKDRITNRFHLTVIRDGFDDGIASLFYHQSQFKYLFQEYISKLLELQKNTSIMSEANAGRYTPFNNWCAEFRDISRTYVRNNTYPSVMTTKLSSSFTNMVIIYAKYGAATNFGLYSSPYVDFTFSTMIESLYIDCKTQTFSVSCKNAWIQAELQRIGINATLTTDNDLVRKVNKNTPFNSATLRQLVKQPFRVSSLNKGSFLSNQETSGVLEGAYGGVLECRGHSSLVDYTLSNSTFAEVDAIPDRAYLGIIGTSYYIWSEKDLIVDNEALVVPLSMVIDKLDEKVSDKIADANDKARYRDMRKEFIRMNDKSPGSFVSSVENRGVGYNDANKAYALFTVDNIFDGEARSFNANTPYVDPTSREIFLGGKKYVESEIAGLCQTLNNRINSGNYFDRMNQFAIIHNKRLSHNLISSNSGDRVFADEITGATFYVDEAAGVINELFVTLNFKRNVTKFGDSITKLSDTSDEIQFDERTEIYYDISTDRTDEEKATTTTSVVNAFGGAAFNQMILDAIAARAAATDASIVASVRAAVPSLAFLADRDLIYICKLYQEFKILNFKATLDESLTEGYTGAKSRLVHELVIESFLTLKGKRNLLDACKSELSALGVKLYNGVVVKTYDDLSSTIMTTINKMSEVNAMPLKSEEKERIKALIFNFQHYNYNNANIRFADTMINWLFTNRTEDKILLAESIFNPQMKSLVDLCRDINRGAFLYGAATL